MEMKRYQKEENFSPEKIAKLREHYKAILELLGEDPAREGLLKTPERVVTRTIRWRSSARRPSRRSTGRWYW